MFQSQAGRWYSLQLSLFLWQTFIGVQFSLLLLWSYQAHLNFLSPKISIILDNSLRFDLFHTLSQIKSICMGNSSELSFFMTCFVPGQDLYVPLFWKQSQWPYLSEWHVCFISWVLSGDLLGVKPPSYMFVGARTIRIPIFSACCIWCRASDLQVGTVQQTVSLDLSYLDKPLSKWYTYIGEGFESPLSYRQPSLQSGIQTL